jgi:hypothetical protein
MLNFLLRSLCTFHLANRTISVTRLSISLISHNSRTALHNTSILELRRECCRPFERYTDTQVPIHGHISQCAVPFAEALSLLLQAYIMSLSSLISRRVHSTRTRHADAIVARRAVAIVFNLYRKRRRLPFRRCAFRSCSEKPLLALRSPPALFSAPHCTQSVALLLHCYFFIHRTAKCLVSFDSDQFGPCLNVKPSLCLFLLIQY